MSRAEAGQLGGSALSSVCQSILDAELRTGLQEGADYQINLQRGKRPNQAHMDTAPDKLISSISQATWDRPTFSLFYKLLDNYTRTTGVAETITPEKEKEIHNFIDEVVKSAPMEVAYKYLSSQNLVAQDVTQFKSQLYQMWFRLYTRETRDDSCGFEHVFVGESKGGEITGMHNWLQFYNLESSGHLDYRGYIFPRKRSGGEDNTVTPRDQIVSVQFNIDGQVKDVSSMWLGTSPEFEMALYTLCFVAGGEKNVIELSEATGTYDIEIRCYHIHSKYGDKVGSAFPVLLAKQPRGTLPAHQQPHHDQPPQQYNNQQYNQPPQQYNNQQYYQPPPQYNNQQQQAGSANQGCGNILGELLKAIFKRFS